MLLYLGSEFLLFDDFWHDVEGAFCDELGDTGKIIDCCSVGWSIGCGCGGC